MVKPEIAGATISLMQEEDCAGRPEFKYQEVKVVWQDGGGGLYPAFESERWAWNPEDLQELKTLVEDLQAVMDAWNKKQQAFNEKVDKDIENRRARQLADLPDLTIPDLPEMAAPAGEKEEPSTKADLDDQIPFMLKDHGVIGEMVVPKYKPTKRVL